MVKAAFGALLVAGAFGGVLYGGGNVMGAWEPYHATAPGDHPNSAPQAKAAGQQPSRRRSATRRHARRPARAPLDAHWVRQANALCSAARRETFAMRQPRTLEELQAFLARGLKRNRHWNARFLRLGAPRGRADEFRRLRALLRDDEALLAEVATAVREGDGTSILLVSEDLIDIARRESRLLVSMGARDCALPRGAT
jgi:hypothetical protein